MVYLQEQEFDISDESDSITYKEAISSSHSNHWLDVIEDEIKFVKSNTVWDLVELLEGRKPIRCKCLQDQERLQ